MCGRLSDLMGLDGWGDILLFLVAKRDIDRQHKDNNCLRARLHQLFCGRTSYELGVVSNRWWLSLLVHSSGPPMCCFTLHRAVCAVSPCMRQYMLFHPAWGSMCCFTLHGAVCAVSLCRGQYVLFHPSWGTMCCFTLHRAVCAVSPCTRQYVLFHHSLMSYQ